MRASVWAALAIVGLVATESLAVTPIPRAYYDFEQIDSGEYFRNVANSGVFDGYLGTSNDTANHPDVVPGLHGSLHALKFDSSDIARVPSLVTDANGDRVDEDVFRGAFSVFARIDPANVVQTHIFNVDRGPVNAETVRGWYMDFSDSPANTSGERLLKPRFNAGGSLVYLEQAESETTNYKNVESVGITWLPASVPGSTTDGAMQIYINGALYAGKSHSLGPLLMGVQGFNIGRDEKVSFGQGIVIDDVAVWDRFLTPAEMLEVHTQGVTLPEPGTYGLAAGGVLTLALIHLLRRRVSPQN
jgi:hypothetical protein